MKTVMKTFNNHIKALSTMFLLSISSVMAGEVRLAVTDLVGLEELQREFGAFVDVLEAKTGHDIKFVPVTNRNAAAQALRFEKVDFVLTGPAEYVVMRKLTDAKPVLGFSRPDYYSIVVALSDSGINLPRDLKGHKVAMGSVGSTSKHLGPMQVLTDYGIKPLDDCKEIFHTKLPVAWEAMKRGDIAAIGTTFSKFNRMREKESEKGLPPGAFKVIGRGPDLPNDVLMVGKHVDAKTIKIVKDAFVNHSEELVAAIITDGENEKYKGMKFLPAIKDSDYNYVREMYKTAGYPEFSAFIE